MDDVLKKVDILLSEMILLQRSHVSKVCGRCENVCCRRVQFLFDEKDMIYQKLSGRGVPRRRRHRNAKGCSDLTDKGCSLEPERRPFACHRHICPMLEHAMIAHDPGLPGLLESQFTALDELRSNLWRIYLERSGREPPKTLEMTCRT